MESLPRQENYLKSGLSFNLLQCLRFNTIDCSKPVEGVDYNRLYIFLRVCGQRCGKLICIFHSCETITKIKLILRPPTVCEVTDSKANMDRE